MTTRLLTTFAVVLSAAALCSQSATAQIHYRSSPHDTTVTVDGAATGHTWEMAGTMIGGALELPAGVGPFDQSQITIAGVQGDKVPATMKVLIPVQSLRSKAEHAPEIMDHLMQEHLKMDQFRVIEYHLKEMTVKNPHDAGKPFEFETKGTLAIAGKTNDVSFPVTLTVTSPETINFKGTVPLKMTDYGVEPPAPNIGLGLMKCEDDIKIIIDWNLVKK